MSKTESWKKHVIAQRGSGMTQSEYCTRNGLSLPSFGYWSRRVSRRTQSDGGKFVSIEASAAPLEVVVGKVVVRVTSGADLEELRRVVEALS